MSAIPKNLASLASLLKEGSNHYRGLEEVVYRNIDAAKQLSKVVRTSMGPNGMNKMVINSHQKLFVTNDAATIIKELDVVHPAAKMIVMASKQQEQEIGDGTNLVVMFAGELLQQAEALLQMGLHVNDVITGYTKAAEKALELLEDLAIDKCNSLRESSEVVRSIRASIAAKQYGWEDILSPLVANACIAVLPEDPARFNVDNVRVCKVLGGGLEDTVVVRGFALPKDAFGTIKHVTGARIAVVACGLEMAKTETKGTVLLKSAQELLDFNSGEERMMEQCISEIAQTGVNVIVSGGAVSDLALHFAERHKLMIIKEASKFNLRRLCQVTACRPLTRLGAPTPEEIGSCDEVTVEEIGSTKVCVFRRTKGDAGIATLMIRGSSQNILDDIERCVDDGVNCFKSLIRDPRLVAGAGALEIELARRLGPFGEAQAGLDQYAFKKFAEALEVVPRTLADNAGLDSTELVSLLYAAHQAGNTTAGVDVDEGGVCNATDKGIIDLFVAKQLALRLATDAAITVLRVDQIIMAKAAGGPKVPQMGARDED